MRRLGTLTSEGSQNTIGALLNLKIMAERNDGRLARANGMGVEDEGTRILSARVSRRWVLKAAAAGSAVGIWWLADRSLAVAAAERLQIIGPNLLLNPSFENGTAEGGPDDWNILNAFDPTTNVSYQLSGGFDGARFVKAQVYGSGGICQGAGWGNELVPIDPSKNYLLSYAVRASRFNQNLTIGSRADISFYDSAASWIGSYQAATTASVLDTWQEINALTVGPNAQRAIPQNAAFALVDLLAKGTLPQGQFCTDGVAAGEVGFDKASLAEIAPSVGGWTEFPLQEKTATLAKSEKEDSYSAGDLAAIAAGVAVASSFLALGARKIRRSRG